MRSPVVQSALTVLLTALGLAASAALLIDYTTVAPVFCAEGGGCDALRQTPFAYPLGVPLPALGVLAFLALAVLVSARGPRVRLVLVVATTIGAGFALSLLMLQVVLRHFCPYCAVVDLSTVALAALAHARRKSPWDPTPGVVPVLLSLSVFAVALVGPFAWSSHEANRVPDVIARELEGARAGEVLIVDFVDFECPFCRQMQATLDDVLAPEKGKVRVVRKLVPLTRIHPHALDAAKAACCADALGKGDAMADALFRADVEQLTPAGCEAIASTLGVPLDAYRACLASPDTEARLKRDRATFDQAARKGDGLPLMWVGRRKLMGAQDPELMSRVVAEAVARAGS